MALQPRQQVQVAHICRFTIHWRLSRKPKMSDIDLVKYGVLWQKVESMEAKIDKMEVQLDTLIELANKGRGGFWMGMTFVSAISTIMGYFSHHWTK